MRLLFDEYLESLISFQDSVNGNIQSKLYEDATRMWPHREHIKPSSGRIAMRSKIVNVLALDEQLLRCLELMDISL